MMADGNGYPDIDDDDCLNIDPDALRAETERLNKLDDAAYELARKRAAKAFGVRPDYFDKQRAKARAKSDDGDAKGFSPIEELEAWPDAVNGASLAHELRNRLLAHVIFERTSDADAAALWVLGAWAFDAWALFPRVLITAPEKQCGKTILASTLGAMVPRALPASNATGAALFRAIEAWRPTLVLDELDTYEAENLDLRNVLNSGHDRENAQTLRCHGDDHEPRAFSTWAPMILSGIGKPAPTVVSRSVVVSLRRKLPHERTERRPVDLKMQMQRARRQAMRWAEDHVARLKAMRDELPDCGDDRRRDNFEPLYRVALLLGGDWPKRLEAAYLAGSEDDEADESAGVMLLRDLMEMIEARHPRPSALASDDMVGALTSDDSKPWIDWRRGKPANARTFAKYLKPYGVKPRTVRLSNGSTAKGYVVAEIVEAFERYASQSDTTTHRCNQRENRNSNPSQGDGCDGSKAGKTQQNQSCDGVSDQEPAQGGDDDFDPENWR